MKGGRIYLPYVFTEQGIYMLMSVLKGELATKQSIALVRMFKEMQYYITPAISLFSITNIRITRRAHHQIQKKTSRSVNYECMRSKSLSKKHFYMSPCMEKLCLYHRVLVLKCCRSSGGELYLDLGYECWSEPSLIRKVGKENTFARK